MAIFMALLLIGHAFVYPAQPICCALALMSAHHALTQVGVILLRALGLYHTADSCLFFSQIGMPGHLGTQIMRGELYSHGLQEGQVASFIRAGG